MLARIKFRHYAATDGRITVWRRTSTKRYVAAHISEFSWKFRSYTRFGELDDFPAVEITGEQYARLTGPRGPARRSMMDNAEVPEDIKAMLGIEVEPEILMVDFPMDDAGLRGLEAT